MSRVLPKRKHVRLKTYDYSQNGAYFVTINAADQQCLFGSIEVGRGLAPAAVPRLSPLGRIVEEQLLVLPERYPFVTVEKYVIMPNHLHVIFLFQGEITDKNPRKTLMQVVGAYKSLAARQCNQQMSTPGRKIWQDSFYESVLQDEHAFFGAWKYIDENPMKWAEDEYYIQESLRVP